MYKTVNSKDLNNLKRYLIKEMATENKEEEAKPGYKTTEFYAMTIASIICMLAAHYGMVIDELALGGIILTVMTYIYGRSRVKAELI